jgi:hypothetical protein
VVSDLNSLSKYGHGFNFSIFVYEENLVEKEELILCVPQPTVKMDH